MDIRAKVREWLLDDFGGAPFQIETKNNNLCEAEIRAKSTGVLAGIQFLGICFDETHRLLTLDRSEPVELLREKKDGDTVENGDLVATVCGHPQILLKAERIALNVLSYTSEIATNTAHIISELSESPETFLGVLDTRKGSPGLMFFEKYAVRVGGGKNHRLGMFDGILIKDNDIVVAGSIRAAIDAQWGGRYMVEFQIEVQSLDQLDEVMDDGRVHMILLDNMDAGTLRVAVAKARGCGVASRTGKRYVLEASGIKDVELGKIARTGVDYLSTSSLVRSAPPLDFNMKVVRILA